MKYLTIFIFLFVTSLLSTGCSIIGGAIGENIETVEILYKNIDMEKFDFSRSEHYKIEKGTNLKILLTNGDSLKGEFIEFKKLSMSEYSRKYAKMRKVYDEIVFPKIHDTIKVIYLNKSFQYYEFFGFDYGCIQVENFNEKVYKISLNNIYKLSFSGNDYAPHINGYKGMMAKGQIPVLSTMVIQKDGSVIQTPLDEISQIIKIVQYRKNYTLEGSLVGLGIDAIIVFLWMQANLIDWN